MNPAVNAPAPDPSRTTPPQPPGNWLLGNLPAFQRDPLNFPLQCAQPYGDVVRLRLGHLQAYLVSRPEYIEDILVTRQQQFPKILSRYNIAAVLGGNGLLNSEGPAWLQQRRLIQPAFHRQQVAAWSATMVAAATQWLSTMEDGVPIDMYGAMRTLTLEILTQTVFGTELTDAVRQAGPALAAVAQAFAERTGQAVQLPAFVPTPGNRRFRRAVDHLDGLLARMITQRRQSSQPQPDLLSMLVHAQDDDGARLSDRLVRDELMTFLIAGHETTAAALTWIWYVLALHPEVAGAVRSEVRTVGQGRPPGVAELPQLWYTEQVVKEVLRLYPAVWYIGARKAAATCTLGGYRVPKGTIMLIGQWVLHRDPRYYPEPERFRPERWYSDATPAIPRFAYFPFGGGPHQCIGNTFALQEIMLVLSTLIPHIEVSVAANQTVTPEPAMTLRPKGGLPLLVRRRE